MTNENLNELMAALSRAEAPADTSDSGLPEEQLREIIAELAFRPAPVRALHRLWTLGDLSSQVALAYFALWTRRWFADAETRKRQTMETNLRVALKMFRHLGYLRGAVTKLGQLGGNLPTVLPDEIAETLDRLHSEAPPMHYSLVREVAASDLGRPPEELFAEFETDAFAAASLGQVHRARLKTGEPVAVKIQYPGIARTIDADLRNFSALLFPMRLNRTWDYVQAQFGAIRDMLAQEVDYQREAETTERMAALFGPEDGIVVPRVYREFSGKRVLTTEYLAGAHLSRFLASNPSQKLRDQFGDKLYTVSLRTYYAYMNYADAHPGNFLFLDDGRLGLLDCGCVQHFGPEEQEIVRLSERLIDDDQTVLPDLLRAVCGLEPNDPEIPTYRRMIEQSRSWMMEPLLAQGAFDFGDEGHLQRGFEWFSRAVDRREIRGHSMYVYHHRAVFGFKSLLYRLRARVNAREAYDREAERWRRRNLV